MDLAWSKYIWEPSHIVEWNFLLLLMLTQIQGKSIRQPRGKYKVGNYGLTFTQDWNTDNTPGTEIAWENKLAEGLKQTLNTIFVLNTVWKEEGIRSSHKWDCFSLGSHADIDFSWTNHLWLGCASL